MNADHIRTAAQHAAREGLAPLDACPYPFGAASARLWMIEYRKELDRIHFADSRGRSASGAVAAVNALREAGPVRLHIRADGTQRELLAPVSLGDVHAMIGARSLDTVTLRHLGTPLHVMLVDDEGWACETVDHGTHVELRPTQALKPINEVATQLYHANCVAGTTHQIAGDVVVLPDSDYRGAA
jgi:hypothetical protein